jgi:hypothetical protein
MAANTSTFITALQKTGLLALIAGMAVIGTPIGDANTTIQPSGGCSYTLPAATFTAARNITLGTASAGTGNPTCIMWLYVYDTTANNKVIINGGAGAGTLFTIAGSTAAAAYGFAYDGTNWYSIGFYFL